MRKSELLERIKLLEAIVAGVQTRVRALEAAPKTIAPLYPWDSSVALQAAPVDTAVWPSTICGTVAHSQCAPVDAAVCGTGIASFYPSSFVGGVPTPGVK